MFGLARRSSKLMFTLLFLSFSILVCNVNVSTCLYSVFTVSFTRSAAGGGSIAESPPHNPYFPLVRLELVGIIIFHAHGSLTNGHL